MVTDMPLIAAIGSKGGVGKTTTLALIAEAFRKRGLSIVFADSDPQGSLTEFAKRSEGRLPKAMQVFARQFEELRQLEENLVLLDTPSGLREESLAAVASADVVIVPVAPSHLDLSALARTLKQVKRANDLRESPLEAIVVPTRINHREKSSRELLESLGKLGFRYTKGVIAERSAYRRASGVGGLEGLPASTRQRAAREIEALVSELEPLLGIVSEVIR